MVSWRESPFLRLPLVQPVSHGRTLKRFLMSCLKAAHATYTAVGPGQAGLIPGAFSIGL